MIELPGCRSGSFTLVEPASWTGREPTDVVGNIEQRDRDGPQLTVTLHQTIALGVGLEMVGRLDQRDARLPGQRLGHPTSELGMRIDAGSHGRAADGKLEHGFERSVGPADREPHLPGKSAEFLAQGQGRGVGQVGASDFEIRLPLARLLLQRLGAPLQGWDQLLMDP